MTVAVEPSMHKTSKKLRSFAPEDRQCLFDDRSITESEEITDDVMHLKNLPYLKANCIAECRRYYMMKFCNCSIDIFYPGELIHLILELFNFVIQLQNMGIHHAPYPD